MPPRKKKPEPTPGEQLDLETAIAERADYSQVKPAELIAEYHLLKAHVEEKTKQFNAWIKPSSERMEQIRQTLHGKALHEGVNAFSTDNGTAYLSRIVSHTIDPESEYTSLEGRTSKGRDALLDWMLDHWDDYGSEGIQVNVSKPIIERWMNDHVDDPQWSDKPPPGLKLDVLVRCNINKA